MKSRIILTCPNSGNTLTGMLSYGSLTAVEHDRIALASYNTDSKAIEVSLLTWDQALELADWLRAAAAYLDD